MQPNMLLPLIALLFFSPIALAEAITVTVKSKGFGRTLSRAEVRIGTQSFMTDPKGQVQIPKQNGNPKIMVQRAGFEKLFVDYKDLEKDPIIYLMIGEPDDNEVIIKGSRRKEVSKKTISAKETARIAPGNDPAQITKILPGVQTAGFGQDIVIRGSGPDDSRYFVDDLEVLNIFHNIGNISIIPDQIIDAVEFSSGGFGAPYTNATGGIIVLRTTSEIPEEEVYEYRLNVPFVVTAFHERPLDEDSSVMFSVRHSLTEWIIPAVVKKASEDGADVTIVPTFADAHIRYLTKTDGGHYKTTFIASKDGVVAAFPSEIFADEEGEARIEFTDFFTVLGTEVLTRLGKGQSLKSTPQIYYQKQDFSVADFNGDVKITKLAFPTEFSQRFDRDLRVYAGINPGFWQSDLDITSIQPDQDDPFFDPEAADVLTINRQYDLQTLSLWASADIKTGDFLVTPGLHYYKVSNIDQPAVDPRLSFRYSIAKDLTFKSAVGLYSQQPSLPEGSKEFGNPDLGFEQAVHKIVGLEGKIDDRWEYDLQLFQKEINNLIRTHPTTRYEDEGTLAVQGFEFFLRRNMTEKTFGWLAYTYSEAEEKKNDESPFYTSPFDQTHILHLALAYKLSSTWEMGTRIKHASGSPYTPVTGSVYNANIDKYLPTYDTDNPYSERYASYDETDLFFTYESFYDEWILAQKFGVQFITTKKRVTSIEYNYDYSESRDVKSSLPPIPYYEIRGRF